MENFSYYLSMDDHCLRVENASRKEMWLNKQLCEWIFKNYESIDFENSFINKEDKTETEVILVEECNMDTDCKCEDCLKEDVKMD